jgi:PTS system mannose-specific IIA component
MRGKSMISIILASHGPYASSMLKSVKMLTGGTGIITAVEIDSGTAVSVFEKEMEYVLTESLKKGEVIILTDFILSTPFNVTTKLMQKYKFRHITGMNLPLVLSLLKNMDETCSTEEICKEALNEAKAQMIDVNQFIKEMIF